MARAFMSFLCKAFVIAVHCYILCWILAKQRQLENDVARFRAEQEQTMNDGIARAQNECLALSLDTMTAFRSLEREVEQLQSQVDTRGALISMDEKLASLVDKKRARAKPAEAAPDNVDSMIRLVTSTLLVYFGAFH